MFTKSKSVLMFFPMGGSHSQDAFAGVRDNVVARNWDFFSADTVRTEDGTVQLHRSSRSAQTVSALVELLHPDGIVIWEDALFPDEIRAAAGAGIPVVFVDCGAASEAAPARLGREKSHTAGTESTDAAGVAPARLRHGESHTDGTDSTDAAGVAPARLSKKEIAPKASGATASVGNPCHPCSPCETIAPKAASVGRVRSDPKSIAAIAARALLPSGYADFAFVPSVIPLPWSLERGDAFERCIEIAGKHFHRFVRSRPTDAGALERWLEALPKPCGVFAANDAVGEEVLGACAQLGIAVPEAIAVIGVDDYAYFCEATSPTLSSIAMNLRGEGRAAVELLETLMASPRRSPPTRFVPARDVVPRASTRFARDRRVARALEFIRLHACTEKFGPRDVVQAMGVSRALADRLFRAVASRTILEEIHAVRLARACELLALGKPGDVVASECGYASHDDFRRVFRTRMGMTARQWMSQNSI